MRVSGVKVWQLRGWKQNKNASSFSLFLPLLLFFAFFNKICPVLWSNQHLSPEAKIWISMAAGRNSRLCRKPKSQQDVPHSAFCWLGHLFIQFDPAALTSRWGYDSLWGHLETEAERGSASKVFYELWPPSNQQFLQRLIMQDLCVCDVLSFCYI